jgi:hypothetical protein
MELPQAKLGSGRAGRDFTHGMLDLDTGVQKQRFSADIQNRSDALSVIDCHGSLLNFSLKFIAF